MTPTPSDRNLDWLSPEDVRDEMARLLWARDDPGDPGRHAWESARRASALDFVRALAGCTQKNPAVDPPALLVNGVEECIAVVEIARLIAGLDEP